MYNRTLDVYETGIIFDNISRSQRIDILTDVYSLLKVLVHLRLVLHTADLGVSRTASIYFAELKKFYTSFKSFYNSASASVCS